MSVDPYQVLGLSDDSDDAAIRRRYLELIRQYTPEHHPEKFTAIRAAYEQLKDLETRVRHRLFEAGKQETPEAILEEVTCLTGRQRAPTQALLDLARRA